MNHENGKVNNGVSPSPAWWRELPAAEKAVLRDVISSIRGLKHSRSGPVAMAARKWERSLACFIKFRLIGERPQRRTAPPKQIAQPSPQGGDGQTTSSPTSGRSQPGASPTPG